MARNPSEMLIERMDQTLAESEILKLQLLLAEFRKQSPKLTDFSGIYLPFEIRKDLQEIQNLRKKFEQSSPEQKEGEFYAAVLEMIVMEFASCWTSGYLSKASEFDDYKRQTDLFLEIEGEDGNVARFSIDVTSSQNHAGLKLIEAIEEIRTGTFHEVKYFQSELDDTKGRQTMPRLIVGADKIEIVELARLFLRHKNAPNAEARKNNHTLIASHRFGSEIKKEIRSRIKTYLMRLNLLKSTFNKPADQIAEQIKKLEIAYSTLSENEDIEKAPEKDSGKTNGVLITIEQALLAPQS